MSGNQITQVDLDMCCDKASCCFVVIVYQTVQLQPVLSTFVS